MSMEFESVIGLEVHVQLATETKIFCGSSTRFGGDPNEFIDPVTLGLPGALPVLNRRVVEFAIMLGKATKCEIRRFNRFARKHYFYPDLPKGYQISQFEEPICERGSLEVHFENAVRTVGIRRIHMEEDAGKNMHDTRTETSLIDLNRAGVPLLEIVSEPDLRTPAEASAYLRTLRQMVRFLGVSDGNMEEGSLRCDANISLRPVGELKFGTRTEIKNLNSFRFVERALEYEIARQTSLLRAGQKVVQETLLYDSAADVTRSMRGKEESSDYRYFPDPDLPPLIIEEGWVNQIVGSMPRLPDQWRKELTENYGLSNYDASVLLAESENVAFFQAVFDICQNAKAACNWVTSELFGYLHKNSLTLAHSPIKPADLGALIKLIDDEVLSGKMAKSVFEEMFATSQSPQEIIEKKGLKQIANPDEIQQLVTDTISKFSSQFDAYAQGNDRLHGFFVGEVMKLSRGAANPKLVNNAILDAVKKRRSS